MKVRKAKKILKNELNTDGTPMYEQVTWIGWRKIFRCRTKTTTYSVTF